MKNKIFVKILAAVGALGFGLSVQAQGDFDPYAITKTIILIPPTNLTVATGFVTNTNTIDIGNGKFIGSAYIDIYANTNGSTNTLTVTPQTSSDLTNWSLLANYAISVSNNTIYTNIAYSGSVTGALLSTNSEVNPFTVVTPVASTAGFATTYQLPAPFTNSGAVTLNFNGLTRIGVANELDLPRYFRLFTVGSGTNVITASFSGHRAVR